MSDKSIAYLVNGLDIGGAEVQVSRLAEGMLERGWRVLVISLLKKPGALAPAIISAGGEVATLHMRPGVPNPLAILRLRRVLNRFRPRVVHSHIVHANLLARVTRLIAPMPILVCTAHNVRESGRMLELSYRYTDSLADLTTNVSQLAVDRYVQIRAAPKDRIRFMPNGLNLNDFASNPAQRQQMRAELGLSDHFVWLAVGGFREQKDYPNMIRAFAALPQPQAGAGSVLVIAGIGPFKGEAEALAKSLNIDHRIRFLGLRRDIPALMNMADAFLLSSAWEGMPLVLQEAGASALPIVATDVGGNREVALDGISAILCPPRDSTALAGAMQRLLALSSADRAKMGEASRAHVSANYGMGHVLDRWEAIYRELDRQQPPVLEPVAQA
jgi:glycosyltransferase involved in cell wall biosynthesis